MNINLQFFSSVFLPCQNVLRIAIKSMFQAVDVVTAYKEIPNFNDFLFFGFMFSANSCSFLQELQSSTLQSFKTFKAGRSYKEPEKKNGKKEWIENMACLQFVSFSAFSPYSPQDAQELALSNLSSVISSFENKNKNKRR